MAINPEHENRNKFSILVEFPESFTAKYDIPYLNLTKGNAEAKYSMIDSIMEKSVYNGP